LPGPKPRVLLVSSSWWAFPAQIAIEMAARGVHVDAVCPRGHPLRKAASVRACFAYRGSAPLRSLRRAILGSQPSLIIPCDDRSLAHLHALYAATRDTDSELADLIEASLGDVAGFATVAHRAQVIGLAQAASVSAPDMVQVETRAALHQAIDRFGLPVVLKVDGSWGGLGVVIATTLAEAEQAFASLSARLSAVVALKRLIVDRDSFSLQPWRAGQQPRVNVQRFVAGRPANCAVACWRGEVLACTCVEVLHARNSLGASTVVRRIDNRAMAEAAALMVRELGLSGLCGFDFLIDDSSGAVHLLECNARATPLCHLDLGHGQDPLAALLRHVYGIADVARRVVSDRVAFFPQCWLLEPDSLMFAEFHHDVPWSEPALIRELVRTPWPERGWIARITGRTRRRNEEPVWIKEGGNVQDDGFGTRRSGGV
jgi:hypothetical protein